MRTAIQNLFGETRERGTIYREKTISHSSLQDVNKSWKFRAF